MQLELPLELPLEFQRRGRNREPSCWELLSIVAIVLFVFGFTVHRLTEQHQLAVHEP
jgi:hypothetical protein